MKYLLLLIPFAVMADTVNIFPPTEREECIEQDADGNCIKYDPLLPEEIGGFIVYDLGKGPDIVLELPGTARSFDLERTSVDQSIVITAVDTEGRESLFSNTVTVPKLISRPKPPVVTVTP